MQIDAAINFFQDKIIAEVGYPPSSEKQKNGEFVRLIETNQTLQVIQRIMIVLFSFLVLQNKDGCPVSVSFCLAENRKAMHF